MNPRIRFKRVWIVTDKHGNIIRWHAANNEEEGFEVHRTKQLAKDSAFSDELVEPAEITWSHKKQIQKRL